MEIFEYEKIKWIAYVIRNENKKILWTEFPKYFKQNVIKADLTILERTAEGLIDLGMLFF